MSTKRKSPDGDGLEDDSVVNKAKGKRLRETKDDVKASADNGWFADCRVCLHPAALGKTRRELFLKRIKSQAGELVEQKSISSLGDKNSKTLLVLIEDNLIPPEHVASIVRKTMETFESSGHLADSLQVVGLSWLSKCLEENRLVDRASFRLDLKYATKVKKVAAPANPGSNGNAKTKPPELAAGATKDSYIERNKHKFVCARSSASEGSSSTPSSSSASPNKHITDQLEKLAAAYKSTNDTWRAFGYQKAISAIKNHPRAITSRDEASRIPNVGAKMADKIVEIIEDGSLRKVQEVCDSEEMRTIDLFTRVWGAGPTTAQTWYRQGHRTLDDLRNNPDSLNKHQKIGLKHFHDLDERMERDEATKIYDVVRAAALDLQSGLDVVACGSYRRGKSTCGDLDILITHPDNSCLDGLFARLLTRLRQSGFLTDDLTVQRDGQQSKYLGVCKLPGPVAAGPNSSTTTAPPTQSPNKHRRLDIIVVPFEEKATALLYFTGSAHFNRSMRLLATKMGMSLSEHALVTDVVRHNKEKLNEGRVLATPTEQSVFEHLGLPYREPMERNH